MRWRLESEEGRLAREVKAYITSWTISSSLVWGFCRGTVVKMSVLAYISFTFRSSIDEYFFKIFARVGKITPHYSYEGGGSPRQKQVRVQTKTFTFFVAFSGTFGISSQIRG